MKLDSKIAIITGGASGLGEAACLALSNAGCSIVVADLNEEAGQKLVDSLKTPSIFVKVDVSNEESIKNLFEKAVQKFGAVHIVVNSAGILSAAPLISSRGAIPTADLLRVFNINVVGSFNMAKYAALQMSKQDVLNEEKERGVIIHVASVAGIEGQKGQTVYAGSKGAIIGMTLPMARDLGKFGIRVCTVAPGVMMTPMGKAINPKWAKALEDQTALGRLGKPGEFGDAVVALAINSYVTGSVFRLDGGIRLSMI